MQSAENPKNILPVRRETVVDEYVIIEIGIVHAVCYITHL